METRFINTSSYSIFFSFSTELFYCDRSEVADCWLFFGLWCFVEVKLCLALVQRFSSISRQNVLLLFVVIGMLVDINKQEKLQCFFRLFTAFIYFSISIIWNELWFECGSEEIIVWFQHRQAIIILSYISKCIECDANRSTSNFYAHFKWVIYMCPN